MTVEQPGDRRQRVALWGRNPIVRLGLATVMAAGNWDVVDIGDATTCSDAEPRDVEALAVAVATAQCVRLSETVIERLAVPTVAIIDETVPDLGLMAARAGAASVLPLEACIDHLHVTLALAIGGYGVLPDSTVALMAAAVSPTELITEREAHWLTRLSEGATVADIATQSHYNERSLYRLLSACYRRLGVSNRADAIEVAQALGFLEQ